MSMNKPNFRVGVIGIADGWSPDQLPDRAATKEIPIRLLVRDRESGTRMFEGALRAGSAVYLGPDRLVLENVKMWAALLIVSGRGGNLLIAGFALGVVGLVWRLLWHRREIFVSWDESRLTLNGRSEQYPLRFREELEELMAAPISAGEVERVNDDDASASMG